MKLNIELDLSKYTKYITFKNTCKLIWYGFCFVTFIGFAVMPAVIWAINGALLLPALSTMYTATDSTIEHNALITIMNLTQVFMLLSLILSVALLLVFTVLVSNTVTTKIREIIKE
jgi:hypothetical protein